ncbi:hypothetical protein MRX96_039758, partial [Rhipicephalus microplus]
VFSGRVARRTVRWVTNLPESPADVVVPCRALPPPHRFRRTDAREARFCGAVVTHGGCFPRLSVPRLQTSHSPPRSPRCQLARHVCREVSTPASTVLRRIQCGGRRHCGFSRSRRKMKPILFGAPEICQRLSVLDAQDETGKSTDGCPQRGAPFRRSHSTGVIAPPLGADTIGHHAAYSEHVTHHVTQHATHCHTVTLPFLVRRSPPYSCFGRGYVSGGWTGRGAGGWVFEEGAIIGTIIGARRSRGLEPPMGQKGCREGRGALAEMIAAQKRRPLYLGGCTPSPPLPAERLLPRPHYEGSLDRVRPGPVAAGSGKGTDGQSMAGRPPLVSAFKTAVHCDGALSGEMDNRGEGSRPPSLTLRWPFRWETSPSHSNGARSATESIASGQWRRRPGRFRGASYYEQQRGCGGLSGATP